MTPAPTGVPSDGTRAASASSAPAPAVDLSPKTGVQYLHAIQAFSPLLENWVVDQGSGELTYTRYNCLGRTDAAGSGTLEPYRGDRWQVTWDGGSPMRLSSSQSERLAITDRTLTLATEIATSNTNAELQKFVEMCKDAGETVAGFVLR